MSCNVMSLSFMYVRVIVYVHVFVLCYVVLCYAMLCYVMLCYVCLYVCVYMVYLWIYVCAYACVPVCMECMHACYGGGHKHLAGVFAYLEVVL